MIIKMWFLIEFSFVDLLLFLKGLGKKILSNVIGKLLFGWVIVVMGLFGVGKIIFLNVFVGKVMYSCIIGVVFINDKFDFI